MEIEDLKLKFEKAINIFSDRISRFHSGRIDSNLIDTLTVEYFGQQTPIKTLAHATDSTHGIAIQPYDPALLKDILSVLKSNNYNAYEFSKNIIMINRTAPSGEDKKKVVQRIKEIEQDAKTSIRNIRNIFRKQLSGSEDEKKVLQKKMDNYHDQAVDMIKDIVTERITKL